jgi:peptidyl-prolyl cis-trans isomerase A (cyclophilin A)
MPTMKFLSTWCLLLIVLAVCGCGPDNSSLTNDPSVPTANALPDEAPSAAEADVPKGETYYALFKTSEGDFIVAVHPGWAPQGAARFRELIEQKYYDDCRFFRVMAGFMAQVGMNGNPVTNAEWQDKTIPDDPVLVPNRRGTVTFAASGQPNSRTSQIFINYAENDGSRPDKPDLNSMGFSPFGEVIEGMEVVDRLYSGYGDAASNGGRGPEQDQLRERGNDYLTAEFPDLDYINTVRIYDTREAAEVEMSKDAAATEAPATDAPTENTPVTEPPASETPKEDTPATEAAPTTEAPATEPKPEN